MEYIFTQDFPPTSIKKGEILKENPFGTNLFIDRGINDIHFSDLGLEIAILLHLGIIKPL